MSAANYPPQHHPHQIPHSPPTRKANLHPSLSDRLHYLLHEIESFLLACTYEEMCSFWKAIAQMRQYFQDLRAYSLYADVPYFLSDRRKNRDFCRILEVLATLNYPKLHLSQSAHYRNSAYNVSSSHSYRSASSLC